MSADLIVFIIIALISIVSSIMVVETEEIFHSALYLALMFVSVAGIFLLLGAEFLAAIQVLIYAGAVVILVLFAIMLTKRDAPLKNEAPLHGRIPKLGIVAAFIFLLAVPLLSVSWPSVYNTIHTYSVAQLGIALFSDYVIPFEVVSVALLAALIGGIFLAKEEF